MTREHDAIRQAGCAQVGQRPPHATVLDRRRDGVHLLAARSETPERDVGGLGGSGREDDLFGLRSDQPGHLAAGVLDSPLGRLVSLPRRVGGELYGSFLSGTQENLQRTLDGLLEFLPAGGWFEHADAVEAAYRG